VPERASVRPVANPERDFRNALGVFGTGVTVITTRDSEGEPHGLTVNSFAAVSLQPRLILWSQALAAPSWQAFSRATHFAVNVLAQEQLDLCRRFARAAPDKFAGVAFTDGLGGVPLLAGAAASLECLASARMPGGDHVIHLGEVLRFSYSSRSPLLFVGGRYQRGRDRGGLGGSRLRRKGCMASRKVIITCAVTGAIHTPSMSPYLPVTPEQIVADAVGAAQAGAAILHLHARDPASGKPDQTPAAFLRFLPDLARRTDAVINLTTGGSPFMRVEERLQPAVRFAPEVASLNMGSINFGLFPMLERYREFKHEWEAPYLESTRDVVFRNTFRDIETILEACAETRTRFEFECYDIAHLYNLRHFVDRGLVKAPLFVQSVFGILGGIGAHPEDVAHMRRTADRLFGSNYQWSVLGAGRNQFPVAAQALALGGHVRVGLEDSLWSSPGRLATSSREQVMHVRALIEHLGLSVATPDEARELLGLKGRSAVNFQ
jgi:uncharacterized protein (DUF849 family)/flavin reductase (DIM6/NTAB) family NADH-FMN oxidoreductase RutF